MKDRFQYRAKDVKTGEWRYGFYAELPYGLGSSGCNGEYSDVDSFILNCKTKQSALYSNAEPHEIVVAEQNRIDIKTLSQNTGLKDKNGKWIYEADVLKDSLKDKLYRVAWWGCRAGFEIVEILPKQSTGYTPQTGTMYLTNQSFNRFAVVGNIYDNPELLEEQCANQLNKG